MSKALDQLLQRYKALESRFPIMEGDDKYSMLVTANGNQSFPVQRWFHLKEAYSINLLKALFSDLEIYTGSIHRVLDPFCGVGTTLLAVQNWAKESGETDLEVMGIERNPFLHFATNAKLGWSTYDQRKLREHAKHLLNGAVKPGSRRIPALSTLHRSDIYDPAVLELAMGFHDAIGKDSAGEDEQKALLLGYASVLEDISGIRKDGRALRIMPNKQRSDLRTALEVAWMQMADDIAVAPQIFDPITSQASLGDGRTLICEGDQQDNLGKFDLIMYSPPYLNNIDYTEVYKIELWMCGFISTHEEFRNQRLKTMRSHPSIQFPDQITLSSDRRMNEVYTVLQQLIEALPRDRYFAERSRVFSGYFDDMYRSLASQMSVLQPNGWILCVVGNSLHGPKNHAAERIPVASDLLIALIASALGLQVKRLQVARHLTRRSPGGHYVRESILAMQKLA